MKKTALLLIFVSICVIPAENKVSKYQSSLGTPSFLGVLEERKLPVTSFCCMYPDVRDALFTINTLTKVSKGLTETIDDTTLSIIKDVSREYNCSNEEIASCLGTKKANERLVLQKKLIAGFYTNTSFSQIKEDMNRTMLAADLNFTYGPRQETLLMRAPFVDPTFKSNEIMELLLKNGIDICARNWQGENALMFLLKIGYTPGINILLEAAKENKKFLAQQDHKGNTALHCCLLGMARKDSRFLSECERFRKSTFSLYNKLEKLLELGINPTIKNNSGESPLMLAQKIGDPSLIHLMCNAIFEYSRSTNGRVRIANKKNKLDSRSEKRCTL